MYTRDAREGEGLVGNRKRCRAGECIHRCRAREMGEWIAAKSSLAGKGSLVLVIGR